MRQISLRVRAAFSTKWGSTVIMALCEGFTTRCILLVVLLLTVHFEELQKVLSIHPLNPHTDCSLPWAAYFGSTSLIVVSFLACPSSPPTTAFFPFRSSTLPRLCCCCCCSVSALPVSSSQHVLSLCHNTVIHVSAREAVGNATWRQSQVWHAES